jgi:hypothetical protein
VNGSFGASRFVGEGAKGGGRARWRHLVGRGLEASRPPMTETMDSAPLRCKPALPPPLFDRSSTPAAKRENRAVHWLPRRAAGEGRKASAVLKIRDMITSSTVRPPKDTTTRGAVCGPQVAPPSRTGA